MATTKLEAAIELMKQRSAELEASTAKLKKHIDQRFAEHEKRERAARLEPLPLRPLRSVRR